MKTNQSPVEHQNFIWVADYSDDTYLSEYDFESKEENSFYDINKDILVRFGLVGYGANLFYEVFGGTFNLAGQMIEVSYKTKDNEYHLTGKQLMYKDIITYKDADTFINLFSSGESFTTISQYNFGYKVNLPYEDINFNFRAIVSIPTEKNVFMNFRLTADKDIRGKLCIKRNGECVKEIFAPLQTNYAGELNWVVK